MRQFKKMDIWISVILILGSFIIYMLRVDFDTLIYCYFVVGGWQCISMIVHAWKHWFTEKINTRKIYHWITLICLATIPVGSFWILLFTAPFMAIFYTTLCYVEVYQKMRRPLALLK